MRFAAFAILCLSGLVLAACAETAPEPAPARLGWVQPPGYAGPVPSPEAQERLRALWGKTVPVGVAGATEPGWVFSGFSVVPSDAAPRGKGPIVSMLKDGKRRDFYLPDDAAVDRLLADAAR